MITPRKQSFRIERKTYLERLNEESRLRQHFWSRLMHDYSELPFILLPYLPGGRE